MKCTCQSTLAPDPRCFVHGEPTLVKRLYWLGRFCLELIAQILRMAWGLIESSFLKLIDRINPICPRCGKSHSRGAK
jgi:hypothetical protein